MATSLAVVRSLVSSTAYHESAHAIVAVSLGLQVQEARLQLRQNSLGEVRVVGDLDSIDIESLIQVLLAGGIASRRAYPHLALLPPQERGDRDDLEGAHTFIRSLLWDDLGSFARITAEREAAARHAWVARTETLVDTHWVWVERVATQLQLWRRLTGAEIEGLRS